MFSLVVYLRHLFSTLGDFDLRGHLAMPEDIFIFTVKGGATGI